MKQSLRHQRSALLGHREPNHLYALFRMAHAAYGGACCGVSDLWLWAAFTTPEDYQQGQTVRIMFIHVPFAWLSMMIYSIMTVSALGTLVWKHPLADVSASAAPIGAVFTILCRHGFFMGQTRMRCMVGLDRLTSFLCCS